MSDVQLKQAVEQAGEKLFQLVHQHFESMPGNATPEVVWRMTAELADKIIGVYKMLTRIAESVPSRSSYGDTSGNIEKDDASIQTKRMLTGLVHRMKSLRNSAFSSACRDLPAPVKSSDPNSSTRVLHEMLFVATDCFVELGLVQPGKHGRIYVFREELRDWLLSALEPFHVVYQDRNGTRTQYGAYKAILLPGANMIGPEFVQLSDSTREIIVTHMSRSDRGSQSYEAEYQNLVFSLKTLPCILLQCVELPPGTYQNTAAHQTNSLPNPIKVQPQPTRRPSPRPPGLPVPPITILNRGSDQAFANPLNNNSALTSDDKQAASGGPVLHPYARPVSSAPTARAVPSAAIDNQHAKQFQRAGPPSKQPVAEVSNKSTPKARPAVQPAHSLARSVAQGRVPFSASARREIASHSNANSVATSIFFQDRWHNVGLTKNTAGGALSAYQNWQPVNVHQNLIQSGEIQRQIVPPRLQPMPLQSGTRSNQANPQCGFQSVGHSSTGFSRKNALDSALLARTQVAPVALYRPPQMRGSQSLVRDQNINPVWYSTESNPPVAGTYGGSYNRGLVVSPFLNAAGMHGDHGNQNALPPHFQASKSYFGQKM